jgi:hypothetical protein
VSILTAEEPAQREERSSRIKMPPNITVKSSPYLTDYLGTQHWKTAILIITTARTSNVREDGYVLCNRAPSCHLTQWQIFNDYGTQSMGRKRQEWEDNMQISLLK